MNVKIHKLNSLDKGLMYVVIQARYKDKWIYVRHQDRSTWEIPGGHIEENEAADNAAARELNEETGAKQFQLTPLADYSVTDGDEQSFGRLYLAEIEILGDLPPFEIEEITLHDNIPDNLTYKDIQTDLYEKVLEYINK